MTHRGPFQPQTLCDSAHWWGRVCLLPRVCAGTGLIPLTAVRKPAHPALGALVHMGKGAGSVSPVALGRQAAISPTPLQGEAFHWLSFRALHVPTDTQRQLFRCLPPVLPGYTCQRGHPFLPISYLFLAALRGCLLTSFTTEAFNPCSSHSLLRLQHDTVRLSLPWFFCIDFWFFFAQQSAGVKRSTLCTS